VTPILNPRGDDGDPAVQCANPPSSANILVDHHDIYVLAECIATCMLLILL
jgi:hypothetical protein